MRNKSHNCGAKIMDIIRIKSQTRFFLIENRQNVFFERLVPPLTFCSSTL